MLRKLFILASLVLVMCSFTGTINYFEGTITYEIKYESNDPVMSTEMLAKQNGSQMKLIWGKNALEALKITKCEANEILKSIEQKTSTEKILDIGTTLVRVIAEPNNDGEEHFTKRDYYFSDDLFIQAGTFDNCKYNSYDQIYSKTNTLPLKMIFENDAYKVTYTAIKIESN